MSYRGIIGYYYHFAYIKGDVWLSEISRIVENHVRVGLQNPVFIYDPETYIWFLDFNRIGSTEKKVPFDKVLETAENILKCFCLEEWVDTDNDLWYRFQESMSAFYEKRFRPKGKPLLVPTLRDFVPDPMTDAEAQYTRHFTSDQFLLK
jgi:hypothetical protein